MSSSLHFNRIAIYARSDNINISDGAIEVATFLKQQTQEIYVVETPTKESNANYIHKKLNITTIAANEINQHADIIVVVGGDGSMLQAAAIAIDQNLPLLGINKGSVGFLADIGPDEPNLLLQTLQGKFITEQRFLLETSFESTAGQMIKHAALNDIVINPGLSAKMMQFEIYINKKYVCPQRADGIIIATPTGSTAYSLSAGGPILYPDLNAIALVPMFPHKLSSRPIVVSANSNIEIHLKANHFTTPHISCDGTSNTAIATNGQIEITKAIALRSG